MAHGAVLTDSTMKVCTGYPWFTDNTGPYLLIEVRCLCRYVRVAIYSQITEHFFLSKSLQMLRVCGQCGPWIHLMTLCFTKVEIKSLKMETYLQPFPLAREFLFCVMWSFLFCFDFVFSTFPTKVPRLGVQNLLAGPVHVCQPFETGPPVTQVVIVLIRV